MVPSVSRKRKQSEGKNIERSDLPKCHGKPDSVVLSASRKPSPWCECDRSQVHRAVPTGCGVPKLLWPSDLAACLRSRVPHLLSAISRQYNVSTGYADERRYSAPVSGVSPDYSVISWSFQHECNPANCITARNGGSDGDARRRNSGFRDFKWESGSLGLQSNY